MTILAINKVASEHYEITAENLNVDVKMHARSSLSIATIKQNELSEDQLENIKETLVNKFGGLVIIRGDCLKKLNFAEKNTQLDNFYFISAENIKQGMQQIKDKIENSFAVIDEDAEIKNTDEKLELLYQRSHYLKDSSNDDTENVFKKMHDFKHANNIESRSAIHEKHKAEHPFIHMFNMRDKDGNFLATLEGLISGDTFYLQNFMVDNKSRHSGLGQAILLAAYSILENENKLSNVKNILFRAPNSLTKNKALPFFEKIFKYEHISSDLKSQLGIHIMQHPPAHLLRRDANDFFSEERDSKRPQSLDLDIKKIRSKKITVNLPNQITSQQPLVTKTIPQVAIIPPGTRRRIPYKPLPPTANPSNVGMFADQLRREMENIERKFKQIKLHGEKLSAIQTRKLSPH